VTWAMNVEQIGQYEWTEMRLAVICVQHNTE